MQVDTTPRHLRRHPRTLSPTDAVLSTRRGMFDYTVSNLSVGGATLMGRQALPEGTRVEVLLRLPLYPEVRIAAEVVGCTRCDDGVALGVDFLHVDDRTEDHIQSALLSEIERSQNNGQIADLL
jgi:PilZ domain